MRCPSSSSELAPRSYRLGPRVVDRTPTRWSGGLVHSRGVAATETEAVVDEDQDPVPMYGFERIGGRGASHRDPRAARRQLDVVWARLGGAPADLAALRVSDPEGWHFLIRYATDCPLNIEWYEARRPKLERKQRRYNGFVIGVAVVLFTLAFLLPFQPVLLTLIDNKLDISEAVGQAGLVDVAALLGVVGTGATVALRFSAQVVRFRRQAAVFHKASAALKEQLYGLEGEWRSQPLLDPDAPADAPRLSPAFDDALRRALSKARAILADERDQFFDTLIVDVNALTDNASAATDALATRAVFRNDRRHEREKERRDLEQQVAEAELARDIVADKVALLEQELASASASDGSRPTIEAGIRELRLELRTQERRYRHLESMYRSRHGA